MDEKYKNVSNGCCKSTWTLQLQNFYFRGQYLKAGLPDAILAWVKWIQEYSAKSIILGGKFILVLYTYEYEKYYKKIKGTSKPAL